MRVHFLLALVFFLGHISETVAQNQNNYWYFGYNTGIKFVDGNPALLSDSQMLGNEGTASISDSLGNLQFYTDGVQVWNKNHVQMPNGFGLLGNSSTVQSALIIPSPRDCDRYYLFTVPHLQDTVSSMCFSGVNMNLDGGLGDIEVKNIPLHHRVAERQSGTVHADGNSYWVVAHEFGSNSFLAFRVDEEGVSNSPVISQAGNLNYQLQGSLKFSPDGSKLCYTSSMVFGSPSVELFDFDNSTGIVSNPITLSTGSNNYGVEFSPDNNKVYISTVGPFIYQFDLLAGSPSAILNSRVQFGQLEFPPNPNAIANGFLQLAPNGKIYIARVSENQIGVINYPNIVGTNCDLVEDAFFLGNGTCYYGLPNQIKSYVSCRDAITSVQEAQNNELSVYPNPSKGTVQIRLGIRQEEAILEVVNTAGVLVYHKQFKSAQQFNYELPETNGLYLIRLSGSDGLIGSVKVVKE